MARSFGLREVILLSALVGCYGFTLPTRVFRPASVSLRMGYLDNLSPQQEDEPKKQTSSPPKKKPSGGVVPSGRGPEPSFLDIMTAGGGVSAASEKENSPPEEETPVPTTPAKPAGWSGIYLKDFLDGNDDSRTDIRNLLTQRSIQSFMFLLGQCRVRKSIYPNHFGFRFAFSKFILVTFIVVVALIGAGFIEQFGGTWDGALIAMTQQPKTQIIISAKRRGRGHGGWSKNNPYLEERWMEMPIDIDPPSLATRILSVREHIAREWTSDLDVVLTANNMILNSYFSKAQSDRDRGKASGVQQKSGEAVGAMDVAFDRTAVNLMNDNSRFSPTESSPFRRGNFDLLYNLCTQAAIHRILRTYKGAGEDRSVPFLFLRDFYTERAAEYFD
eukprot:scaffold57700_cov37-Attheya_sp.AAC.1